MKEPAVIADAGPIRYLVQLGHISVLQELFERVLIPQTVASELSAVSAPEEVSAFLSTPPGWLTVKADVPEPRELQGATLHRGERAAVALATGVARRPAAVR